MKAVAMAHDDAPSWRRDGKVGYVGTCLPASQYHDGFVDAELLPSLELRGMKDERHILNAGDTRYVRQDMKPGTYSNGIALPGVGLSIILIDIGDDVASSSRSGDGLDGGG